MNDLEKSILLAEARGWGIEHLDREDPQTGKLYWTSWVSDNTGTPIKWPYGDGTIQWTTPGFKPGWREFHLDFYKTKYMEMAWQVKQWAHQEDDRCMITKFSSWYDRHALRLSRLDAAEAQREWLDKIIALLMEEE